MKTTTRTKKFATHKETSELAPWRSKTDYAAKLAQSKIAKAASRRETIRRKEVRNLKKSFDRNRRSQ